ncbi:MAG: DUF2334 domain-containing protein, partial [Candidatus Aminicenantales bacterium]
MKTLVAALHDAAPPFLEELRELSGWMDRNAIRPRCIKVIPDFLGQWKILDSPEFLDWARAQQEDGHEIILHGLTHCDRHPSTSLSGRLRDLFITRGQAEFLHASREEARALLAEGRRILEKAGLAATGFTAPTWFQSEATAEAAAELGFRFVTTRTRVYDLAHGRSIRSVAIGYMGIPVLLEAAASLAHAAMRKTGLGCSPLARVVLHPVCGSRPFFLKRALKGLLTL